MRPSDVKSSGCVIWHGEVKWLVYSINSNIFWWNYPAFCWTPLLCFCFDMFLLSLVGGLEHEWMIFPYIYIYWEFHHPNWRTHSIIFQRGRGKTTSQMIIIINHIITININHILTVYYQPMVGRSTTNQVFMCLADPCVGQLLTFWWLTTTCLGKIHNLFLVGGLEHDVFSIYWE